MTLYSAVCCVGSHTVSPFASACSPETPSTETNRGDVDHNLHCTFYITLSLVCSGLLSVLKILPAAIDFLREAQVHAFPPDWSNKTEVGSHISGVTL